MIGLVIPAPVFAQDCGGIQEEIVTLKPPSFTTATSVWDLTYGKEGMDKFSMAAVMDDGTILAAGEYTKDEKDGFYHPLLVRLDTRAKTVWETRSDSKTHKTIADFAVSGDGVIVAGEDIDPARGFGIYTARYGLDGKFRGEKSIFEKGANLDVYGIQKSFDGKNFILSAQYKNENDKKERYGLIFKIGPAGNVVWRRAYRAGPTSYFYNVQPLSDKTYMALGSLELEDGRQAGWLVKIDDNGAISWQRPFPRGRNASLRVASERPDGSFIVAGDVEGSDTGVPSAWIMAVDSAGNLLWQRYYRGKYFYRIHDIKAVQDGRITVLLKGDPLDHSNQSYVSFLTLGSLGQLLNVESFVEGYNAHAMHFIEGAEGERIIVGHAQTGYSEVSDPSDISPYTFDAWLVAATALEKYTDPCVPSLINP